MTVGDPFVRAPRIGSGAGRVIAFGLVQRTVFGRGKGGTGEGSESDPMAKIDPVGSGEVEYG
jgi:hypothetical protein